MNEHQAEILLTRMTTIAESLERICTALEGPKAKAKAQTDSEIHEALERAPNEAPEKMAEDEQTEAEEKAREGISFDQMSMKLASYSRDLPRGVFSHFMKKSILPKYADNGGGISTIDPESYEDVLAECTEFFESRSTP